MSLTEIRSKPIVDSEDVYVTATVPLKSGNLTDTAIFKLTSFYTKLHRKGFIRALGNAVAAGGEGQVTFRLLINGGRVYPYDGSQSQWGVPSLMEDLPQRIPVPAGALVEVQADNADTANDWEATVRVWMEYEDL